MHVLFHVIKKRSFNLLCVLDLFSERWQLTLFQIFCFLTNIIMQHRCHHSIHDYDSGPQSEATDIVISGISLALTKTSGPKKKFCCVKSPMSGLLAAIVINLHDTTNSKNEISTVGVQLPQWWVPLL